MGENKHIEELDAFAKKYIKQTEQEIPPLDFTANVMDTIIETKSSEVFKATPLIPKSVWFLLFSILALSIHYVSKGKSVLTTWTLTSKFKFTPKFELPDVFQHIAISNIMFISCFFFTLLIFIQMYLFKTQFDNKFNS